MGGSAILGTNLVDSLIVDVVDGLRDALHTEFGVRQFRVFTVTRTWVTGIGDTDAGYSDVEVELTPQPLVIPLTGRQDAHLKLELQTCGIDEAGIILLHEVSLTYTEEELSGIFGDGATGLDKDTQQFLYKLTDAHGQKIEARYYLLNRVPVPDRIKNIGWIVELKKAE